MNTYIAIDLKSFYASAECVDRGLDPLTARLVVADESRTDKTICLAVSPSLKAYGISGRARLWEVRSRAAQLKVDFIIAPPRMKHYMEVSAKVVETYLKYVSMEDMVVYSIDEVFIDATEYLRLYNCTAQELATRMIRDVLETTGITATAGIGTNPYLCKVAMDIVAKHAPADERGVRLASLDEMSYRRLLWEHKPLTDFWRFGKGAAARLEKVGINTMGELALRSLDQGWLEWLYKQFGVNAELLIDHAWGREPCTIADIKAYRPKDTSISSSQVLKEPYSYEQARNVLTEMITTLALDLVRKRLITDHVTLTVSYDSSSAEGYEGPLKKDFYGRTVPKPAHGSCPLGSHTSSEARLQEAAGSIWTRCVDKSLTVRRLTICAEHLLCEDDRPAVQPGLFDAPAEISDKERRMQEAVLSLKARFGKNSVLRGVDFCEGATTIERNSQVGGHKA